MPSKFQWKSIFKPRTFKGKNDVQPQPTSKRLIAVQPVHLSASFSSDPSSFSSSSSQSLSSSVSSSSLGEEETMIIERTPSPPLARRPSSTLTTKTTTSSSPKSSSRDNITRAINSSVHTHHPSSRVIILVGKDHIKLWDFIYFSMKAILTDEEFKESPHAALASRLMNVDGHHTTTAGTVLFLEKAGSRPHTYRPRTLQPRGLASYTSSKSYPEDDVHSTLYALGLASSIQFFSGLIESTARQYWNLPSGYRLVSQMPFGQPSQDLPLSSSPYTYHDDYYNVYA
eukprot:TRINITY_DN2808_c0_g1_i3.p1 TRINITY_DN2808_c0_g1~~TRINITY_DN2808_c0_g1_i3.p1  ORF type:complete len:285 (+),score=60.42 TRINITY_DN2808_c0_g1_i3:124-978(+)